MMKFLKKSGYTDYAGSSKYFRDDNKDIDQVVIDKQKRNIIWIQEFSKKIVTLVSILYVGITIYFGIVVSMSFQTGYVSGIDTFISEMNNTFRDIIGGYIVKSAVENVVKIGGNYYIGIIDAKIRNLQNQPIQQNIQPPHVEDPRPNPEVNDVHFESPDGNDI